MFLVLALLPAHAFFSKVPAHALASAQTIFLEHESKIGGDYRCVECGVPLHPANKHLDSR